MIGKPRLEFARVGVEHYAKRLRPLILVEVHYLKSGRVAEESRILEERSKGMKRIVLDERGEQVTSRGWAQKITDWELGGTRDVAFLIGGADGHSEGLRAVADWRWSLSGLTLQHEMALVLTLEQIYRSWTLKTGHPYHRD